MKCSNDGCVCGFAQVMLNAVYVVALATTTHQGAQTQLLERQQYQMFEVAATAAENRYIVRIEQPSGYAQILVL